MKQEYLRQFDEIISRLKPIEPSLSFDYEFRRRLEKAQAESQRESAFDRIARIAVESVRYALLPKVPALVSAAATFLVIMAAGLYLYNSQPEGPILVAKSGVVMMQAKRDIGWKEVRALREFRAGDTISTKENAEIDIELPGKYAIRLKGGTALKIAKLTPRHGKGTVSLELSSGNMLVDIEQGFKPSALIVNTKVAEAKALGTKFSVDVRKGEKDKTRIRVLEGNVAVKSRYAPEEGTLVLAQTVFVGPGQKTEVAVGRVPLTPQRLVDEDWRQLEELYQIGKRAQVILLVKNTPDRAKQLLKP